MASLNQITLLGRVGITPAYSEPKAGLTVARFTLATSKKYKDKEETQWHRIVAFNSHADFVDKYVHKGDALLIQGEVKYNTFTTKEGKEVTTTDIFVNSVQIVASCTPKAEPKPEPKKQDELNPDDFLDDLPFA